MEKCHADIPGKASKGQPPAPSSSALFHPLALSSERQVQDWPFFLLALSLAVVLLAFVGREAAFLAPTIPSALSLLPAVALATLGGAAAFALFLWLSSRVRHQGFVALCLWVVLALCMLVLLLLAACMGLAHWLVLTLQQQLARHAQEQFPFGGLLLPPWLSIRTAESAAFIFLAFLMLLHLAWAAALVWVNKRKDVLATTTTLLADTASFFLSKGRKILLLLLACFALSALLLLPVLVQVKQTVELCTPPQAPGSPGVRGLPWARGRGMQEVTLGSPVPSWPSLLRHAAPHPSLAAAALGHALHASSGTPPLANARALYELAGRPGNLHSNLVTSPVFPQNQSSVMDLLLALHLSPECKAQLNVLAPGSPSSIVFGILGLLLLPWVSRMVSSAFVFLSSFCLAEEAAASASASACRTPVLRILSLCFWHSLGTLTFGSFLMDLLGLAMLGFTGILVFLGAPLLATAFLLLGLLLLVLFQLLYYKLVIPIVAIHGCSLFQAFSKALSLVLTFPHHVLALHVASSGLGTLIGLLCSLALEAAKVIPVSLLGSLYSGKLGDMASQVTSSGASRLVTCFMDLWMAALGASLINSLHCQTAPTQIQEPKCA